MKILILFNLLLFQCDLDRNCDLLKNIFSNTQVEKYLHTNLKERKILYFVENDLFNCDQKINDKLEIKMLHKKNLLSSLNYVEVLSYKIENDILFLILEYPKEGVFIDITFNKSINKISTINIVEK